MPQMGESIAEGTVSQWLKSVGDAVERDEPILEISTDKVDAEIPAPASGTLVEIAVEEGETVEVGTIVAYIDTEGGAASDGGGSSDDAEEESADAAEEAEAAEADASQEASDGDDQGSDQEDKAASADSGDGPQSAEERLRTRSTPVVRKIAEEHGVDIGSVSGTGHAGRVTKQDILDYIESGGADKKADKKDDTAQKKEEKGKPAKKQPAAAAAPSDLWKTFYNEVQHPEFPVRSADEVEPMDKIRRLTAEHMVLAKRVAPHVHSFIEIDFSAIDRIRAANKPRWKAQGARVSYTAFVAWAVSRVLHEFPTLNSTVSGNNVIYRGNVNLGMAVDLNPGLIVPVVHDADHLGLVGIGNKIVDLATRARDRKLQPGEIQGATFSITNPGVLGTMVGMPIIPKGTSAILG
ncbi:MAG: dihydrolipoamide acetyltransferase family protein, partial [Longimicrobiales bacterium]|nr:dihydrolipoamide acetyltransferase family protein [Longimicrobiales bacterium]